MTFQPAVDCAEIVINATMMGKPIANVLNIHFPDGYSQADLDNISEAVDGLMNPYYVNYCGSGVVYDNVTVRGLTSSIDLISINGDSTIGGQADPIQLPGNVTLCFRLSTGYTGRSARGRFYAFPATTALLLNASQFTVAYGTAIVLFLSNVMTAVHANGADVVVLSRFSGGVPRLAALPTQVIAVDYRNLTVDSQRGRLLAGH